MALKVIRIGSVGPLVYDDAVDYIGEAPGVVQKALKTDGDIEAANLNVTTRLVFTGLADSYLELDPVNKLFRLVLEGVIINEFTKT